MQVVKIKKAKTKQNCSFHTHNKSQTGSSFPKTSITHFVSSSNHIIPCCFQPITFSHSAVIHILFRHRKYYVGSLYDIASFLLSKALWITIVIIFQRIFFPSGELLLDAPIVSTQIHQVSCAHREYELLVLQLIAWDVLSLPDLQLS